MRNDEKPKKKLVIKDKSDIGRQEECAEGRKKRGKRKRKEGKGKREEGRGEQLFKKCEKGKVGSESGERETKEREAGGTEAG